MRKIPILIVIAVLAVLAVSVAVPAFSAPAPASEQASQPAALASITPMLMPNTTPMPGRAAPQASLGTTYVQIRPDSTGKGQSYSLNLGKDSAASFAVGSLGDAPEVIEKGTWVEATSVVTVTLTDKNDVKLDAPDVLVFERKDGVLTATQYDKAAYGESGIRLTLAAQVASTINRALFTIALQAGFPLDPTFLSVNGGGEFDASLLNGKVVSGCAGFVNRNPVAIVNWAGKADLVRVFFYSSSDPSLVILTPDGKILCSDNATSQLLDPEIEIKNPIPGKYRIWVGSVDKGQLIPGVLVMTAKSDVNAGNFSLNNLIDRPAIPELAPRATPQVDPKAIQDAIDSKAKGAPQLKPGAAPATVVVTTEGKIPLFTLPVKEKGCAGLVSAQPDFVFNWSGDTKNLRVFFEGDKDSTLLVLDPNRQVVCNDESDPGVNLNPMVDLPSPASGNYAVWVGRLNPTQPVKGKLTVTEGTSTTPAALPPAAK